MRAIAIATAAIRTTTAHTIAGAAAAVRTRGVKATATAVIVVAVRITIATAAAMPGLPPAVISRPAPLSPLRPTKAPLLGDQTRRVAVAGAMKTEEAIVPLPMTSGARATPPISGPQADGERPTGARAAMTNGETNPAMILLETDGEINSTPASLPPRISGGTPAITTTILGAESHLPAGAAVAKERPAILGHRLHLSRPLLSRRGR